MVNKTKNLLRAAKYVLDQTDNPDTGGIQIGFALEDLKNAVAEFESKETKKYGE